MAQVIPTNIHVYRQAQLKPSATDMTGRRVVMTWPELVGGRMLSGICNSTANFLP